MPNVGPIVESQGFRFEEFLCNRGNTASKIYCITDEKEYQRY